MNHSLNEQLMARKAAATARGVGVMGTFFADRADNAELWDVEGRRFIDFAGGIAVMNSGHGHPKVVAAIEAQLKKFTHTCYQVVPYESYIALAEKLNALTPGSHAKKSALFSTGAEAIENAIKIARSYTKRSGVIAFSGAFHGRSLFAVSLTGKVAPYKLGFGPFPPEIYHAPYPDAHTPLAEVKKAVNHIFKADIEPSRVAAIVFEPVQGEGGFNVIQAEAVQWLRQLCDEHGIVLIADEIQTGFGRTGTMFAMEHFGVVPDLMPIASSNTFCWMVSGNRKRTTLASTPQVSRMRLRLSASACTFFVKSASGSPLPGLLNCAATIAPRPRTSAICGTSLRMPSSMPLSWSPSLAPRSGSFSSRITSMMACAAAMASGLPA